MQTKVSVVILNWNGSAMMHRFLPSVVAGSPEAEIVVADNGSTDDSCEMLRREFPMVRIIALDRNYGFAEGYNRALAHIETPYTVLLNDDVEVAPGWLAPLIAFMESHPDAAACQPKIRSERHRERFEYAGAAGGFLDRYGYPFCRGRLMETVETDADQYDAPCRVLWTTGAAMFVRTEVFRGEGGLDARFFAHCEEIDLCWRLRNRGYTLWCVPQSTVYHVGGATLNPHNPRKTFLNFRNNLLMLYKNLPEGELRRTLRVRCILDYVAALQMLLTGHWGEAAAVVRARREFGRMRLDYEACRQANRDAACDGGEMGFPEEVMRGSLLWQYYVRVRKRFSDLPFANKCGESGPNSN